MRRGTTVTTNALWVEEEGDENMSTMKMAQQWLARWLRLKKERVSEWREWEWAKRIGEKKIWNVYFIHYSFILLSQRSSLTLMLMMMKIRILCPCSTTIWYNFEEEWRELSGICGKGIERREKRMKWKRKKKSGMEKRNRLKMERREMKEFKWKIKERKLSDSGAEKEIIGTELRMEETREEWKNSDSCLIPINLICENECHRKDKKMKWSEIFQDRRSNYFISNSNYSISDSNYSISDSNCSISDSNS